jgi:hypothetical protein
VKSDQTIRNWIKEFQEFFSANTAPGKGSDIQLTDDDMRVLDLIATMREDRRAADEIYASLKAGQRGNVPRFTPEELDPLVKKDYESYLSTQLNELSLQIDLLQRENAELKAAVQPVREQNIRLETEKAAAEKRIHEMMSELQAERERNNTLVEKYLREIAALHYKIGQLEKRDGKAE